jgi:hypothetical protein
MKKMILAAIVAATTLTGCLKTGDGEKIGMVTKLAKQGVMCPTYEGEIVRGGLNGGSGVNGASFHFTVESEDMAKKVKEAMEGQKEVKITYSSEFATLCRSDSGNHFLTSIDVIEKKAVEPNAQLTEGDQRIVQLLRQLQAELAK